MENDEIANEIVAEVNVTDPTDDLSPAKYASEIVRNFSQIEDLEGDGAHMAEKFQELLQDQVNKATEAGLIQPGDDMQVNMMIRDPNDGEATLFLHTQGKIGQDGQITLSDSQTIPCNMPDGQDLRGFSEQIKEHFDQAWGEQNTQDFVSGNQPGVTAAISISPMQP